MRESGRHDARGMLSSHSDCQLLCVCRQQLCCLRHLTGLRRLTVVAESGTAAAIDLTGLPASLEELTLVTPKGLWLSAAPAHKCQVLY